MKTDAIKAEWEKYREAVSTVERLQQEIKAAEVSRDVSLMRLGNAMGLQEGHSRQLQIGGQSWIIHRNPNRFGRESYDIEPTDAPVTVIL